METRTQMLARLDAERQKLADFAVIREERREELLYAIQSSISLLQREYYQVSEGVFFASADVEHSVEHMLRKGEAINEADEAIDYANHQIEDIEADLADDEVMA